MKRTIPKVAEHELTNGTGDDMKQYCTCSSCKTITQINNMVKPWWKKLFNIKIKNEY